MSAQGWWVSILLGRQAGDPCSPLQAPKGRARTCNLTPDPNSFTPGLTAWELPALHLVS